jgi:hypothetical protein
MQQHRFASRVFLFAAIYGFIAGSTLFLTNAPDPHRLLYFAFGGIVLVFQCVFVVISRDPARYVALMPLCILEKLSFGVPAPIFYARGQTDLNMALGGAADLVLAVLFFLAWRKTLRAG